jgi:hypothetical protein
MDKIHQMSSLIRLASRSSKESDFQELPDHLSLSFVVGMLVACLLAFGLLLWPGLALLKIQDMFHKWRFYH